MYLLNKRVDQLAPEDILRLIESQVQESITLDYKMELSLSTDNDKKEFLYDITSMMNAQGGCFVIGLRERKSDRDQNTSTPEEIVGVTIDNEDKFKQQIEDIIKNSTDPKRSNIAIRFIGIEGKKVLVIGVSKGLGFPTMVTYKGTNKFYKRRNSGKYLVDVHELNQMFMQNDDIVEKTTSFRLKRIRDVRSGNVFPGLALQNSLFLHIFPFSFGNGNILDLSNANEMNIANLMMPMYTDGYFPPEYNVNGYCVTSRRLSGARVFAYDQLFRTGAYEAYTSGTFENYEVYGQGRTIYRMEGKAFILTVLHKIRNGLSVLKKFEIEPPFIISLSLHGMKGGVIMEGHKWSLTSFFEDEIMLAPQIVPIFESDINKILKPSFDILWQSLGYSKSPEVKF